MSSGVIYPVPTYIPPLPVFNPLFFPQSFDTTTTSGGGGGGQTNIFPNGLTSGNVITMDGGTGGGGGTGVERTITGISYLDFVDSGETDPTNITGYITLNGNTLEIGSNTASSGINVNLLGSVVSANGVAIATGGNVSNDISNNFLIGTTQTFQGEIFIDNTQSNIGQYSSTNTGLGLGVYTSSPTGTDNTAIGLNALTSLTTGADNTIVGSQSGVNLTTATSNSVLGVGSLISLTTGADNTCCGWGSLSTLTTDSNNVAIGFKAGYNLNGTGSNSSSNTFVGYQAGLNQTTGNYNVAVGYSSGVDSSTPNLSNTIAIGNEITSVATGDMIFGFNQFFNSYDYWAKFTPNTTSGTGITLQGTYNNSSNITISSPSVNITNILTTPNNSTINANNLTNGQGTFYVSSQLPYFSYNNAGTITSQQLVNTTTLSTYAPLASPIFTGTPTAPTALSTDNSTQLATTAFVKNALTSSVQVVSITSSGGESRSVFGYGTGTFWIVIPPVNQPTSSNPTPPYGYSFNYSVYTNFTGSSQTIVNGDTLSLQGLFTTTIGTGASQTFTTDGVSYWGYVLSAQIVTQAGQGGLSDLYCAYNQPINGSNYWYFFTASTDNSLLGTSLIMDIYVS